MESDRLINYVQEMKKGNLEAFNPFYEETKKPIFYNILSLTKSHELSEDLLHDTYVKFLKDIKNIDEEKSILGYLMVMSRNLTLDYLKRNKKVSYVDDTSIFSTGHEYDKYEDSTLLNKIKKILNDKEYEIFILHALNDLTFKEIASLKKKPLGTIIWSYNNSIKKIQKEVNYEEDWWKQNH